MICMLAPVGNPCPGADKGQFCTVFTVEGTMRRTFNGTCNFKSTRAPAIGIYAVKGARKKNPLKASKKKDKE